MAEIVALNATSPTEEKRQRFEAFVRRGVAAAMADQWGGYAVTAMAA